MYTNHANCYTEDGLWVQKKNGWFDVADHKFILIIPYAADAIADVSLLVASFKLFLVIQDKPLRCRLSLLHSTCVITTAISLVNSSFILTSKGLKVIIIALVEVRKNCALFTYCLNCNITDNLTALRAAFPSLSPTFQFSQIYVLVSVNTRLGHLSESLHLSISRSKWTQRRP